MSELIIVVKISNSGLDIQWAEYRKRRRHFWLSFFGIFLVPLPILLIVLTYQSLFNTRHIYLELLLALFLGASMFAYFGLYVVQWYRLLTWPCPRCGRSFVFSWLNGWPTNRCKHCETVIDSE
jgi:hypothetical protein